MNQDLEILLEILSNSSKEAIRQAIANVNLEENVEINFKNIFNDNEKILKKGGSGNDEVGGLFNRGNKYFKK